jgi:DHA2 family multidrug resistance protein
MKLAPTDGPFVSGMFNMVKGLASAIAAALIDAVLTWREHIHSNVLLDRFGASRFVLTALPGGQPDVATLDQAVRGQALVLALADLNFVVTGIAVALLLLLLVLPTRVYPPAAASVPAPPSR